MQQQGTSPAELARELWPETRAETRRYGGAMLALLALAAGCFALLANSGGGGGSALLIFACLGCIGGAMFCLGTVLNRRTRRVMSRVAPALGLDYDDDGESLVARIPAGLVPQGSSRTARNHFWGVLGERRFDMAELTIRQRKGSGKHASTRTVFAGLVLRYRLAVPLEDIRFSVPQGGLLAGLVSGLFRRGAPQPGGAEALLRMGGRAQDPAARLLAAALERLPAAAGPRARLSGAQLTGGELFVALERLPQLFGIGFVIWSEAQFAEEIRRAWASMRVPFDMMAILLEAEDAIAKLPAGR